MLECPKTARMKDFLKLFKTVMDFKGLSFIVTEQPFIKKLRPVFYFATVKILKVRRGIIEKRLKLKNDTHLEFFFKSVTIGVSNFLIYKHREK